MSWWRQVLGDKRFWFCIIVYPLLFWLERKLITSSLVLFLTGHAPMVFLVTFILYAMAAVCVLLDVVRRLFGLKVQGRALKLQEKEKERIRRDE